MVLEMRAFAPRCVARTIYKENVFPGRNYHKFRSRRASQGFFFAFALFSWPPISRGPLITTISCFYPAIYAPSIFYVFFLVLLLPLCEYTENSKYFHPRLFRCEFCLVHKKIQLKSSFTIKIWKIYYELSLFSFTFFLIFISFTIVLIWRSDKTVKSYRPNWKIGNCFNVHKSNQHYLRTMQSRWNKPFLFFPWYNNYFVV